jgi:hypothetical protein
MTIAHDRANGAPLFVEFRPSMRSLIEDAVESLLLLLDEIDGDADIEMDDPPEEDDPAEDGGDGGEPSLGWTGNGRGHPEIAMRGYDDDREDEHDGREPDVDDEPSLGSGSVHIQTCWAVGGDDDREHDEAERSGCGDMDGVYEQHGFGVQCAE